MMSTGATDMVVLTITTDVSCIASPAPRAPACVLCPAERAGLSAPQVLSVVAGQYASILDAPKSQKAELLLEEEATVLTNTVGAFITTSLGYARSTELRENLKRARAALRL